MKKRSSINRKRLNGAIPSITKDDLEKIKGKYNKNIDEERCILALAKVFETDEITDLDYYDIRKALKEDSIIEIGRKENRVLIINNSKGDSYYEFLYFHPDKEKRKKLMARVPIGDGEMVRMAKKEDFDIEKLFDTLRELAAISLSRNVLASIR